jgi:hypothetical protein
MAAAAAEAAVAGHVHLNYRKLFGGRQHYGGGAALHFLSDRYPNTQKSEHLFKLFHQMLVGVPMQIQDLHWAKVWNPPSH